MSEFNDDSVNKWANTHLDNANASLPQHIKDDVARARQAALQQARQAPASSLSTWDKVRERFTPVTLMQVSVPVAVAVMVTMLVSYSSDEHIPALPVQLLTENVPAEDLDMLEELEFATWLAEQDIEATS